MYPVIDNHPKQAEYVASLARRLFRSDDAVSSVGLPMMGAEDFSCANPPPLPTRARPRASMTRGL